MICVTIPFGRDIVIRNLDLGLFYVVAISVLSVLGLVMAGWGSANKYAVLGGLRAASQLLSYEIPFIMAILSIAMISQSLDLQKIVDDQSGVANIFPALDLKLVPSHMALYPSYFSDKYQPSGA